MIRRVFIIGGVFLFVFVLSTAALAVSASLWEQDSQDAFEGGEPDSVSITAPGKIILGPKTEADNLGARYTWSLAEGAKGKLFAGTGSEGNIFAIPAEGKPELFAHLDLQQVFALISGKNDTLYAGGFPGGKVYSINAKGAVSELFDTGQAAVWALQLGQDGAVFAATGDDGKIFRINPDGSGGVLYDSPERRFLSLIGDREGNLYAGSDQNGIIYKFNKEGKVFVLYDTELEEVTAMALDAQENLYAVSAPGNLFMKVSPPQSAPVLPKAAQAFEGLVIDSNMGSGNNGQPAAPLPGMPAIPNDKKRTCIIYRIDKNGAASKFWTSPEKLIFSLAFKGEHLLAGSGDEGVIYLISPIGEAGTYYKADQKQVLDLHETKDGSLAAGLGNDAATIRFTGKFSAEGTYYSEVHDATAVSKWGRVFWDAELPAGTQALVSTRSGNSEKPDDTWSEWAPANGSTEGFVSPSPNARYIQWRAQLKTSDPRRTPELSKMTIGYLQNNLPPQAQSVNFGAGTTNKKEANAAPASNLATALKAMGAGAACPPNPADDAKDKANTDGVKKVAAGHNSTVKIQWQAQDANNDKLQYDLFFRGTEERTWKPLEKELSETSFDWDTETVPDGDYQVKVVVTDKPDNPVDVALQGEKTSDILTIDNTAPVVKVAGAKAMDATKRYQITGTIMDDIGPVSAAHYSIDAGEWTPVFPQDGIFDSPNEKVSFETGSLESGEHTVVLKAVDYFGNIGAGKVTFVAP